MGEEKKEYKFCLEVRKDEGYVIEWTSDDKNIGDFLGVGFFCNTVQRKKALKK